MFALPENKCVSEGKQLRHNIQKLSLTRLTDRSVGSCRRVVVLVHYGRDLGFLDSSSLLHIDVFVGACVETLWALRYDSTINELTKILDM